jgi:Uma2 family endonuclease
MSGATLVPMAWHHTIADYVRLEASSGVRHEYIDGDIRAMSGGTLDHSRIASKIGRLLGPQLEGRPCETYSSDTRVRIRAANLIVYPDMVVGCGPVEQDTEDECAMLNPTVVVEVTSPSSEDYDRGGKLANYKLVPSIGNVVIVSHATRSIEVHHREADGTWSVVTRGAAERVELASIGCVLDVDAVYHDARSAS